MDIYCNYRFIIKREFINKLFLNKENDIPGIKQIALRHETLAKVSPVSYAAIIMLFEYITSQYVVEEKIVLERVIKGQLKRRVGDAIYSHINKNYNLNRIISILGKLTSFYILTLNEVFKRYKKNEMYKINEEKYFKNLKTTKFLESSLISDQMIYNKIKLLNWHRTNKVLNENLKLELSNELEDRVIKHIVAGLKEEREPILTIYESGITDILKLHFYYFDFRPFIKSSRLKINKHFAMTLWFKGQNKNKLYRVNLLSNILLLSATKLNWIGVDDFILKKIKPIK